MRAAPFFEGKVVGVVLGRTGSNSLCEALNPISIRTKHFPGLLTADDLHGPEASRGP